MNPAEDNFDLDSEASLKPDENEVLVAYLDGQLDAEQCELIEARLATDAAAREKLQSLDRVWNALDALPRSTASPTFTRTTVEMAAVSASQKGVANRRLWRPPVWLLAGGIGVLTGLLLTLAWAGAPQRQALNHLPTLLNAAALENVGSIDFLKLLDERAGDSLDRFLSVEVENEAEQWDRLVAATTAERREWIAALPPDELTAVNSAADRFADRSRATRDSLQELSRRLEEDPDASTLRETAIAYQAMVSRLSQGEQARLRQMSDEERLRYVLSRSRHLAREAALELNDAEREAFRAEIDRLVESKEFKKTVEELAKSLPPLAEVTRREPRLVLLAASRFVADQSRRARGPGGERFRQAMRARFEEQIKRFEEEVVAPIQAAWTGWADRLTLALPPSAQEVLGEAKSRGEEPRSKLMHQLLRDALASDLSDAFVSLSEDEMGEALLEPRDRFTELLSENSSEAFDFDAGRWGGGPPRGFEGRGPRSRQGGDRPSGRFRDGPPNPPEGRPPFGPGDGPPPRPRE